MSFQIVKIPDLPVAASVQASDQYPIETADGTKRVTQSVIDTYEASKYLRKNVNETTTGTITAAGFTVTSSIKLKEKIAPLAFDLVERVLSLVPVSYTFKKDSPVKPGQDDVGLIAEQVQPILPQIVSDDGSGNLSIDYAKLSIFLLLVLKQIAARQ